MFLDGLILMTVGMGAVFSFLIFMVITMILTSKIVQITERINPETDNELQKNSNELNVSNQEIAIAIAVTDQLNK